MKLGPNLTLLSHPTWPASHGQLKAALGLHPNFKMPPDFELPPQLVGDTQVYVRTSHANGGHRVIAICNICEQHVPAGRLHQHRKVHIC
jgi:hypothetical protein